MANPHSPALSRALAFSIFWCVVAYCVAVHAACGCFGCLAGGACYLWQIPEGEEPLDSGLDPAPVPSSDFRVSDRWNSTAIDGTAFDNRGDPLTVTWSIIDDGINITGSREGTSPSNLVSMLNGLYGAGSRGDIRTAPWFRLFEESFDRWEELSGLNFEYEPADGGATINQFTNPRGSAGVYADIRIGGHSIDGASGANTLAYAYFPDHGDIVFDTDNSGFYGNRGGDSVRLRNTLMHEIGHSVGLSHLESNNSNHLMEPSINPSFDGPQIDDILAIHRNYGDVFEKDGGNDGRGSATPLGDLEVDDSTSFGVDGSFLTITPDQTDFVSIDGSSDVDYYSFTINEPALLNLRMLQVGPTYNEGPQGGTQSPLVTRELNELSLEVIVIDDTGTRLVQADPLGRVPGQSISDLALDAGDYTFRVFGSVDNVQLYRIDLALAANPIPEPAALALVTAMAITWLGRRR